MRALWIFCLAAGLQAQTAPDRTYKILRENEDWSFLSSSQPEDVWDPMKYIRLRGVREGWFLTLGGEMREVFERIGNDNWGQRPFTDTLYLQRYMMHADARFGSHVRTFVQFKTGLESSRRGGPRPIDEKKLDVEAAFLELGTGGEGNWFILRAGRQELNYGSGRLVSVREGPNVRQSFDGLKIRSKAGVWNLDAFAVRPDLDRAGFFNNAPDHHTLFWGGYATRPIVRKIAFDAYYLGITRKQFTYYRGTAQELRQTLGARVWKPVSTKERGFDFDYEGASQLGTFGTVGIRAWTVASDTGYSFPDLPLKPRISMKADISSGDDPRSGHLGTFSPLFPVGNYFGVIADTGPGPVNFIDVHPRAQFQLPHSVTVATDLVLQWRENLSDGVYSVPGFLLRGANGNTERFVGYRPGIDVRWQIDRHFYVQADYGVFFAGPFLRQTGPGRNLNYFALWVGYKF